MADFDFASILARVSAIDLLASAILGRHWPRDFRGAY